MPDEGNALLGHAIAAAKVAPVGDGNSEIINLSVVAINHGYVIRLWTSASIQRIFLLAYLWRHSKTRNPHTGMANLP
jgi:hypothetical protein